MATNGILVTSYEKGFGPESKQYAARNNITLIDGREFVKLMRQHGEQGYANSEEARKDDKHLLKNRHQNSVRSAQKRPANAAGSADAPQHGKRPCVGEDREGAMTSTPPSD